MDACCTIVNITGKKNSKIKDLSVFVGSLNRDHETGRLFDGISFLGSIIISLSVNHNIYLKFPNISALNLNMMDLQLFFYQNIQNLISICLWFLDTFPGYSMQAKQLKKTLNEKKALLIDLCRKYIVCLIDISKVTGTVTIVCTQKSQ